MRRSAAAAVVLLIILSFYAGSWHQKRQSRTGSGQSGRQVLYYVDPMHPSYKSDKPGIAPDCGMSLEPVYAGGQGGEVSSGPGAPPAVPGTVKIGPERQQLIGVRVEDVRRSGGTYRVHTLGKVAVDDTKIYRLNSAVDGWITDISSVTVGSTVKKDQQLASYYAPEFLGAEQAYLYALGALDRFQATGKETPEQIRLTDANIQQYKDSLRNLGMSNYQVEELARTRQLTENIYIVSPVAGFVIARNITAGQRFEKGIEFYRIADLRHVWVLADIFENEAQYFEPGVTATVSLPHQRKSFSAKVSDILPQFDPGSRTFKVRLEADNPGFALRPEMFVDVDLPVVLPPSLTVPMDAVLDSGLKKIVFVDRGKGYFEPRKVETGWRFGDRIQVVQGLAPGERIVVSGNFLIDSESRMQMAASGAPGAPATDPSCGHTVDMNKAKAAGRTSVFRGTAYYFCSAECKEKFDKDPERSLTRSPRTVGEPSSTAEKARHD